VNPDFTIAEIRRRLAAIGMPADEATATAVHQVLADVARATEPLNSISVGETVPAMLGSHRTCAKLPSR
jgi:hypothetical protein